MEQFLELDTPIKEQIYDFFKPEQDFQFSYEVLFEVTPKFIMELPESELIRLLNLHKLRKFLNTCSPEELKPKKFVFKKKNEKFAFLRYREIDAKGNQRIVKSPNENKQTEIEFDICCFLAGMSEL